MSGSAPRGTGDDLVKRVAFANVVPGGGVLCQGSMVLPGDAASVNTLMGTFGAAMPRIALAFKNEGGGLGGWARGSQSTFVTSRSR